MFERLFSKHNQITKHEFWIPTRLGVDLVERVRNRFSAAGQLYGGRGSRAVCFASAPSLRQCDLRSDDKGVVLPINAHSGDNCCFLRFDKPEIVGKKQKAKQQNDNHVKTHRVFSMRKKSIPFQYIFYQMK